MAFWSAQGAEPLRQYRWYVDFGAVGITEGSVDSLRFALKKVDKPKAKIGEITHKYMNHFFYYPGRLEWEPINITFASVAQPSADFILNSVLINAGYGVPSNNTSDQQMASIGKTKFNEALGKRVSIFQVNPDGVNIEEWQIYNPFFTSVQFGSLDYGSEEIVEIQCTIRYDYAKLLAQATIADDSGISSTGSPGFPSQ